MSNSQAAYLSHEKQFFLVFAFIFTLWLGSKGGPHC